MSDPGTSYRTREEVQKVRQERDCIKQLQSQLQKLGWIDENKAKLLESEVRRVVEEQVAQAKADPFPSPQDLWTDIYAGNGPELKRGVLEYEV